MTPTTKATPDQKELLKAIQSLAGQLERANERINRLEESAVQKNRELDDANARAAQAMDRAAYFETRLVAVASELEQSAKLSRAIKEKSSSLWEAMERYSNLTEPVPLIKSEEDIPSRMAPSPAGSLAVPPRQLMSDGESEDDLLAIVSSTPQPRRKSIPKIAPTESRPTKKRKLGNSTSHSR